MAALLNKTSWNKSHTFLHFGVYSTATALKMYNFNITSIPCALDFLNKFEQGRQLDQTGLCLLYDIFSFVLEKVKLE